MITISCNQLKKGKDLNVARRAFKVSDAKRLVALQRLTADHLSEELFWRVPEERNTAHQELVEDDPHGPPVHRLPVALPEDHLGGNVLRRAAHLRTET